MHVLDLSLSGSSSRHGTRGALQFDYLCTTLSPYPVPVLNQLPLLVGLGSPGQLPNDYNFTQDKRSGVLFLWHCTGTSTLALAPLHLAYCGTARPVLLPPVVDIP